MPNHISQRIVFLRKLAESGLHQENLDRIVGECSSLSQDTQNVLVFFVLKHVFRELSDVLEGEAVQFEQFNELNAGLCKSFIEILNKIENAEDVTFNDLESLVRIQINNVSIFKSGR